MSPRQTMSRKITLTLVKVLSARLVIPLLFAITAQCAVSSALGAQQDARAKSQADGVPQLEQLRSPIAEVRNRAARLAAADYDQAVAYLLELAKRSKGSDRLARAAKSHAVQLLGKYRAVKAVDFLVEDVAHVTMFDDDDLHPLAAYDCAKALVAIGAPSIPAIFRRLDREATERELCLYAWVTWCIAQTASDADEKREEFGILMLQHKLDSLKADHKARSAPATEQEKNLVRLIEVYRSLDILEMTTWP